MGVRPSSSKSLRDDEEWKVKPVLEREPVLGSDHGVQGSTAQGTYLSVFDSRKASVGTGTEHSPLWPARVTFGSTPCPPYREAMKEETADACATQSRVSVHTTKTNTVRIKRLCKRPIHRF